MLRWTLRKAKTAESFVLLFWKEDSVEFGGSRIALRWVKKAGG